ncbi:terpenoid synthase [Aspergillus steynii IBT 23096]|uniref:Terpenoid synthase n=1 Tax=Aspergillus steynii IBT 23096 TaxID=1392250 RepID=A0A2I2GPW5_9EURO|nr:terpenoid synthase [Aspergillus steynii IBT 23096]PLB54915.1 terpenoid synthase [Aspergillus steynii IBT 23096]
MAKPISFSYTPKGLTYSNLPTSQGQAFSFLNYDTRKTYNTSDSVTIQPSEWDLAWPSAFPAARQCKYWKEAQASCEELIREIRTLSTQRGKAVPDGFRRMAEEQRLTAKESMIVTSSVDAATYMIPNSSCERITVIAKLWMLLWTQDDVLEYHPEQASLIRVSRGLDDPFGQELCAKCKSTSDLFDIRGHPMHILLESFAEYILFTNHRQRTEFKGLRDYLDYRSTHIAVDHIFSAVRFGNDLDLSQQQIDPLRHFSDLIGDHTILVNDLFSFDKEKHAAMTEGACILNAVNYLEQALSVSPTLAKDLVLRLILDIESQLQDELCQISEMGMLSEQQTRYAHAMIECVSGNLLFSVTSIRYAKYANSIG